MKRGKRGYKANYNQSNRNESYNNYNPNRRSNQDDVFSQAISSTLQSGAQEKDDQNIEGEVPNAQNEGSYYSSNYSRMKGNPFAKNTHKNQSYKKREYIAKHRHEESTPNEEKHVEHNISPDYNPEFSRIQGKILDIEIKQEDEANKEEISNVRELVKNQITQDYDNQIKNLKQISDKKELLQPATTPTTSNIFQEIISKNEKLVRNPDLISNLVEIINSNKNNDEVQQDFIDLLGYEELETISEFIQNRDEIKELISVAKTVIEESEKIEKSRENLIMFGKSNPNANITIERMEGNSAMKLKKKHANEIHKSQLTNLKILQHLGFDSQFLRENEMLGLKEKKMNQTPGGATQISGMPMQMQMPMNDKGTFLTESVKMRNHVEINVKPVIPERIQVPRVQVSGGELPKWAERCFNFPEFNEIQSSVFHKAFKSDENLLIAAPTGAGKTNIALLTILREIHKQLKSSSISNPDNIPESQFSSIRWNFKIVYLVPLKALANEIVAKFKTSLSFLNIKVNEFSGDVNLSKEQTETTNLFVAIPEKWDLFTRKNEDVFTHLKLMIIDEVHLLNEDRGRVLECIVARTIRKSELNQKFIRICGLSATLPNYWDVAEFLRVNEGLFSFDTSYRATPLKMKFLGVYERRSDEEYREMENSIVFEKVVNYLQKGRQVLVFVHSRMETINFARDLIKRAISTGHNDLFVQGKGKGTFRYVKFSNKSLEELAPYGIGFHNAGVLRKDRNMVETLFANKTLNVLVSTSTLAWGVNLPAYCVIIKGISYYDASKGSHVDIGILDIQQMFGRAGRPQFDKKGVAMIVSPFKKVDYFVNLLKNQIDIESSLGKFLPDALNAEIAIGNILSLDDAVGWLKLTYLSIRLTGINRSQNLNILGNMANEAFEILNKYKLIRYVKSTGAVHSTELGRIACKYYMSYKSIACFYDNMKEDMYDGDLLNLFSLSEEFSSMRMYPEEKTELEFLAQSFDLLSKNSLQTKDINAIPKPIILLQTYLKGYYEFRAVSLHMDTAYIVDNSPRIMRAMVEIALHKHLIKTTFLCLNYMKLIERRVFPGSTPLWQFTYESNKDQMSSKKRGENDFAEGFISPDICRKLDTKNLTSVDDILNEDKKSLGQILSISPQSAYDLIQFARVIPKFQVEVEVKPITRTILNIAITLIPKFKWKKKWNHLSEPFWIIVDDKKEIIHYEYFILPAKNEVISEKRGGSSEKDTVITFAVPFDIDPGEKEARVDKIYTISILSDRWVGCEYCHPIYLQEIEVPQDQDIQTDLIDLNPLPLSVLNNPEYEKVFSGSFTHFNPVQTQVFFSCFHSDENLLIGAPTGSGKTVVAELAILRVFRLKPYDKIIYIAPLKSLAKERLRDWNAKFTPLGKKVLELTGDFTPDVKMLINADILITTPEKWDGISRNWHHRTYVQRVALVIIDEIHLLGLERGPVLEVIVSRMRFISEKTKTKVRFVGLSTALANSYDVAQWLGISTKFDNKKPPGLFNFKPAVRPCPVTVHIEGFSEKHYCPRMGTMNKPCYNAIRDFSQNKPVLVFVSSRRQTRLTALDLISLSANNSTYYSSTFLKIPVEEIHAIIELIKDENLKHTLTFGIGMHHAGLVEGDRRIVEELFFNSKIQVLIATSTLAWGVNFPAHLVVIKGTEYYDPKLKTYVDMPITDILQMIGRAGRPQYDDSAVACLFVTQEKKNFYKKFLYEPFPLESSLHKMLYDHINAEIAAGMLSAKSLCVEYITWTYFFRRLLKNPSYYGLKSVDAKALNEFLGGLVDNVLKELNESKCINIHSDNSLSSTLLGYLASFYYISYKTAYGFEMTLKPGLRTNSLIEILSDAQEFAQLPVRHNEEDLNEALAKLCPFEVDQLHLDSPHIKTNLLIQAHLSRVPMPISDYATDTKLVLDNCIRIILFMIDIAAEKGYLDTTINLIVLNQMVMQGMWLGDSALMCLPHLTIDNIRKLYNTLNIAYLPELIEQRNNIDNIFEQCGIKLNSIEMKAIKNILNAFPNVQMSYKCYALNPNTLERIYDRPLIGRSDAQISVKLEKLNKEYDNMVVCSRYSKYKTCRWFLMVGNEKTKELLGFKKVSFRGIVKKSIDFIVPNDIDDSSLQLYLFSDSYLGLDQQYPLLLKSINDGIMTRFNLKEINNQPVNSNMLNEKSCDNITLKTVDQGEKVYETDDMSDEEFEEEDEVVFDNW